MMTRNTDCATARINQTSRYFLFAEHVEQEANECGRRDAVCVGARTLGINSTGISETRC